MIERQALFKSLIFHGVVVASFTASLPFLSQDIAPEQAVLTVDIVDSVDETNLEEGIDVQAEPSPSEEPPEEDTSAEESPPESAPPPPPEPEVTETAESIAVPSEKPEPKPAQKLKSPPKRPTERSPEFKKRAEQQAQLTKALQDLTKRSKQHQRPKDDDKKKQAQEKLDQLLNKDNTDDKSNEAEEKEETLAGQALNTQAKTSGALGISDIDRLRDHFRKCWNPPPGAAGADTLIVDIIVRLNENAEVQEVEIVDKGRFDKDPAFRAAAHAARQAVVKCGSLPLPKDKYDLWKTLEFEFNPRFITRS